jgi:hypothetical protein
MAYSDWIEVALFIHGITTGKYTGSHDSVYDPLYELVQNALQELDKPPFDVPPVKVEWGWQSGQSSEADRYLSEAESSIHDRVSAIEKGVHDLSPLRPLDALAKRYMMLGFADLFYYVSRDGENSVRRHVFGYLNGQISALKAHTPRLSLTIIAHSAGTIIAHDLMYHLFRPAGQTGDGDDPVRQARELAQQGKLRIRRFYSMGSPITPLTVRANSLMTKIVHDTQINPEDIGLRQGDGLSNPRWVNFWDEDDLAAFPVEFLYANETGVIEDHYIRLGGFLADVHGRYWTNEELARTIAETF